MPLNGMQGLKKKIRRMDTKLDRKPQQAANREAGSIVANMRANVAFNDAIASGELLNGIAYRLHDSGVVIESAASHSGFVEFGTGPRHAYNPYTRQYNKPEFSGDLVASLIKWATIKPTLNKDPVSFGHYVARKISGELEGEIGGTDPQPFFVPAWETGKPRLVRGVENAVEAAVKYS